MPPEMDAPIHQEIQGHLLVHEAQGLDWVEDLDVPHAAHEHGRVQPIVH